MNAVTRDDSGSIKPGSTARVRQPKLRPATWVVDEVADASNFTWHTSGRGYRITAAHLFEPHDGGTSARLQVTMTGALSPLLWTLTGRMVRRYLDLEAAALKRHCEATA
jgi:hypothetical protein